MTRAGTSRSVYMGSVSSVRAAREVTLLDLLDRLLAGGIVIQGEVTLAAADIDLVNVSLRAVVAAVESLNGDPANRPRLAQAG
jgi:Gas vesicle protein